MSGTAYASGGLTEVADPGNGPGANRAKLGIAAASSRHARSYALSLLDAAMLLLAAFLTKASALAAGIPSPGIGSLLLFATLCFALLALSRGDLGGERLQTLTGTGIAFVPLLTGAAAAGLGLWQWLVLGAGHPAAESAQPWLLATAYLLAGRLAFKWAAADHSVAAVSQAIDRAAKRAFDVCVAGLLLVLTAPVIALVALAIKLEDRGPVFFRCTRFGELGRDLPMLKFRKMSLDADGPPLTSADDERFTRVGGFLASSKLDELPQLWNVLRGQMSLVGPRPEDPWFVALRPDDFAEIVGVKPGVTGLCQLAFAKEGEILDPTDRVRDYSERLLPQKIAIDLLYAQRRTFLFDAKILLWTFVAVLLRKDVAVNRRTGDLTLRRRRSSLASSSATS